MDRDAKQRQLIIDFQNVFTSEWGTRVLERLSLLCNENEPTFVDQNPTGSAYKEGQRSVILHIRKMLAKNITDEKQESAKTEKEQ